jgi:glycosyltransferase involved in cell wall biosynthesis
MRTLLISAYACEPLKGSEQGVGWNWVLQMAKHNKLHVITRANNQEPIETHLPKDVAENITFHYYDTHPIIKGLKNRAKGLYFYYFCWQLGIIPLIKRLTINIDFDYSMHLTFGNIWLPTFLPFFKTHFIWGTLGGGEAIPTTFLKAMPTRQFLIQNFRILLISSVKINPLFLFSSYKAKAIICRTNDTVKIFQKRHLKKIKIFSDGAIEKEIFFNYGKSESYDLSQNFKIISTSKLIGYKNVISIVKALEFIPDQYNFELLIIGDGPEKKKIKKEINKLSLNNKVKMISELTREKVLEKLSLSDVFITASLRDACNISLLEAMAVGLPVICLNWSGMSISTDHTSAIKLPVTNPQQMPKDLASAICKLIDNPTLRNDMGMHGRERIKNLFNWDSKGTFMENLLNELDSKKETC